MGYNTFISYRRKSNGHIAGRMYEYLNAHNFSTFLDVEEMSIDRFDEQIKNTIPNVKNFILILSPGDLAKNPDNSGKDWLHEEIKLAVDDSKAKLIVFETGDIENDFASAENDQELGKKYVEAIRTPHRRRLTHDNFHTVMDKTICEMEKDNGQFSWKKELLYNCNIAMMSRQEHESEYCSLGDRFGREFVDAVSRDEEYDGNLSYIEQIRCACYAGTQFIFDSKGKMDDLVRDKGLLFKIIRALLKNNDEFCFEMVFARPDSSCARDAKVYRKLGNRTYADQQKLFLDSYNGIKRLINEDPVFKEAYDSKRFRYYLTDETLPYAIMQVTYRDEWKQMNHIKVDIYSEGIESNVERQTFCTFEDDKSHLYKFFESRYNYIVQSANGSAKGRVLSFLSDKQIEMALDKNYRQYLAGRLEQVQPYLPCIDDDIEVGISYYRKFTADKPHMHPVATEHGYILSGKLRLMLLDDSHETFEFRKGDFFVIPTGTAYAAKNAPHTKILFVKSPGGNDKQLVEVTPEVQQWISKW